jgi:two-component system chemotaxis sensor kinase CheA
MDDLVSDFVCEAGESLAALQAAYARLALSHDCGEAAGTMLRRLHALKGLCGFAGFARAEALADAGEGLLAGFADGPAPTEALTGLGEMLERLHALIAGAAELRGEPDGDDGPLLSDLEALAAGVRARRPAAGFTALPEMLRAPLAGPAERRAGAPWSGLDTLARTLGDRLGKRIDLAVGGDDVRFAPGAAGPIRTALIAMVRNACDHGVETPAERRAAGKPALSILRLSVHRRDGGVAIELADDGRGVDPATVRAGCVAAGRLDAASAAGLSDAEAQALIFEPGVTTAGALTSLSGRGLGLELVREQLAGLGGGVEVRSTPGQGARFVLTLPGAALASAADRGRVAA